MSDDTEKVDRLENAYAPDVVQELPRRVPGPWCWLLIGVCMLLLVLLRVGILRGGMEQAAVNVTTAALVLVSLATLQIWFLFFSGYSASARYGSSGALFLVLVVLAAIFRIDDVSGDLEPTFAFRWQAKPDRLLDRPSGKRAAVDLSTTSELDFPQFLGPQRGNRVDSVTLADNWTEKSPELLWRISIGAGWSSFAVVNGYAVTMEQRGREELITCYEVATGKLCWWHAISTRHQTLLGGVGPRCTPTISEGKVYALGATGVLRCVDGATGHLLWSDNLLARIRVTPEEDLDAIAWGRASSPLVVDQLVVVPLGGPLDGPWNTLAAFDKHSGQLDWIGGERQASYSSPCLATLGGQRQILIVCQDYVGGYAVESGQNLWEHPWPGSSNANANVSQIVPVGNDRLLLSKGYGGGAQLLCVSLEADDRWKVEPVWKNSRILRTKFSNLVIHAGYIYGLSDGILQCVDLESGRRMWKGGRYEQGQILGVGQFLLVQAEAGDVFLVLATPEGHRERGSIPALHGKTWNNPALFGKHLLVRNAEHAACYRLP